jgi:A/G-specific adenine glycosylase
MHHSADGNLPERQIRGATPRRPAADRREQPLSASRPTAPSPPRPRTTPGHAGSVTAPAGRLDPERLAAFFATEGRDLPWRRPDAGGWGVLVSEVMLQQTPVARVLPVYLDWMRRWPTPAALAADSPGAAVRVWGRLGYPRRALRLHAAAVTLVADHDGRVPGDLQMLLALPGVGEYTARAVAAFAFGQRQPVVDTNVRRVFSRAVRGVDEHGPATARDRDELERLLPSEPRAAAAFSAALMELGALRCTVTSPACHGCPLADGCDWLAAGRPAGPARKPAQTWHGTDRQMRGRIMALLRDADGPLPDADLRPTMPATGQDTAQWRRCLDSLLADGLAVRGQDGLVSLPGAPGP